MGVLDAIRRLLLRDHEDEHRAVDQDIAEMRAELTEHGVRMRRLEIDRRVRERRIQGEP